MIQMAELKNCEQCGDLFASVAAREICPKCYQKEERDFQRVYRFITKRKNRQATIQEIVEATEVREELIIKFMKQNRLRSSQFPNLAYACDKCGDNITEGRLCSSCAVDIQKAWRKQEDLEASEKKNKQRKEAARPIYYSMNNKKNENI